MGKLRMLGVHGLGDHRHLPWKEEWEATVRRAFPDVPGIELEFRFLSYDHIFEKVDISAWEATVAVYKLLRSGATSIFGSRARARGARDPRGISEFLRRHAGCVVAWLEDEGFRKDTRAMVLAALEEQRPDVVLAHSLGSLVTYNAITHGDAAKHEPALRRLHYVTLGSQLGNAFVRANLTPGRLEMPPVAQWRHLYNEEDDVFTSPIRFPGRSDFCQIETSFDIKGVLDHSATHYLEHRATRALLWEPLAQIAAGRSRAAGKPAYRALFGSPTRAPKRKLHRRALLVGIDEYPAESDRLAGCVNDVFLMSEALQECGFAAQEIRVCLNRRATAQGIIERLDWLVDDPRPNDVLFFFYSGHGAQLPTYGMGDSIDRMDETLVPWDFDWSPETCVTDDQIFDLYAQLPYETGFVMVFDCCHSGGIHRAGAPKARGLNPPDDIRHRGLRWDVATETWEQRKLEPLDPGFSTEDDVSRGFFGKDRRTARLGRAAALRRTDHQTYERALKESAEPIGPYLPVILEACAEEELAYEYRHGAISYGAFTYSLVSALRRRENVNFENLVLKAADTIQAMGYSQHPQLLGPARIVKARVPWMARKAKKNRKKSKS
ncbi:MAG: peptidase C14 [Gemmatimonadetes bacterium]|nr:peptidase C14 [Gemmatimonadota bacterium]